ncbi:hypothetical protein [Nocardia bhagyanarayanae]|uniref:Secreted protein n=1 Tax=Nocardia bhagyanarayanae TaxID=1215925 RepID=A0A543EVJ7_9NOCA|nr:hypothetical protein [Nocardia bhagyanarayanae]TQM25572.1 hypothetical protein FB390_5729 [Nocardia bhagyanarayanae]
MDFKQRVAAAVLAGALLGAVTVGTAAPAAAEPSWNRPAAPVSECFPPSLSGGIAVCVPFSEFLKNLLTGSASGSA